MQRAGQNTSLAAQAAAEKEQQAAVQQYYETVALLQDDAARAAEAKKKEAMEQQRLETQRMTAKVKALKEKALVYSAENVSKQELIDSMEARLTEMSTELGRVNALQQSSTIQRDTEEQRVENFVTIFESTMDRSVRKTNETNASVVPASLAYKTGGSGPRVTKVFHTPEGQAREVAAGTMEMRLGRATTFREVCANAARYFGEEPALSVLEDEHGTVWPLDAPVSREIARYRGDQTIRLVQREEAVEAARAMEDDEEEAEKDVQGLDSDSDDDDLQKKEYVEPPLNRRREYFDMGLHILFLILLFQSITEKRTLREAFALTESLQTIFVDEEFGDFNEKSFMDIRNFEEAWEWTNGVLVDGLFDSDVDDTGNIMMYNQLVGAVRLRQMRVTNTSCYLSPRIQRRVQITGTERPFTQSLVFQADNFGDGGGCFDDYERRFVDTSDFGPCLKERRDVLIAVPGVTLEQLDKYNETCGGDDPSEGTGFKYYPGSLTKGLNFFLGDDGGYVKDIIPDEPLPGADIPRVPKERMLEDLDELLKMLWLDERTRAMIISFSVYNANFNLYAACSFAFLFSPGGVIKPIPRFKVMKIGLYEGVETADDALGSVEVQYDAAVMLLLLRLILKELTRYIYIRWNYGTSLPYLSNVWNILELMNIAPFIVAWSFRVMFATDPLRSIYQIGMFATRYAELGPVAERYTLAFAFDSISLIVSFLKLFKYFRLFDATALLWNVLESSAADMGYFFFTLLLFLSAFVMFAEQLFGPTMLDYSDPLKSFTTLLNQIFGVVDIYWEMIATAQEKILAMIFFFVYTIIMFFILVNVFLAILNDAYGSVKGERDERMAQLKAEKEERDRLNPPESAGQRMARLQRAASGRFHRFQARVSRMVRRRKVKPQTPTDVIDSTYYVPST